MKEIDGVITNNSKISEKAKMMIAGLLNKKAFARFPKPKYINDEIINKIRL